MLMTLWALLVSVGAVVEVDNLVRLRAVFWIQLWDHVYCVGCIMRGEGLFNEARQCFELCLKLPGLTKSKWLLFLSFFYSNGYLT